MPIGLGLGASSTRPTVSVQVAFAAQPNTPGAISPTWTTLKNKGLNVTFARSGRTDELELYQSGEATINLRNADGAFNPANTSGPYYGQLLPYKPIRIVASWGGVDYPLWQGYVERWPQGWTDPTLGFAQIKCVDALAILNNIGLDSAYAAEILSAAPRVYYPLSEQTGATTAGNQSANSFPPAQIVHTKSVNATTPGTYSFGETLDVPAAASQTGLLFTGTNNNLGVTAEDGFALTLPRVPIPWTGWTTEVWCQIPKTPAQYAVIYRGCDAVHFAPLSGPLGADPPGSFNLYHNGPGSMTMLRLVAPDGVTYLDTATNFNLADGNRHHVAVTYSAPTGSGFVTATVKVYIDGALEVTATFSVSSTATVSSFVQLGGSAVNAQTLPNSPLIDGRPLIGTLGHFAIYPTALPISTIQGHYEAGLGFPGEVSGDRAARVLAYGGWQSGLQQLQQGRSTMGPAAGLSGQTLLSAVQDVSDTELGTVTTTANGLVDFRSRDDRLLKTSNSVVFGDGVGEIPFNLPQQLFDFDPTLVSNDVQVTRASGPVAESFDQASILNFFIATKALTMNLDTDDQAQQAADFVLGREKNPAMRVETLTVNIMDGTAFPTVWPALLGLDLHDRVGVRVRPKGAPPVSVDGFVEQLSMTIDGPSGQWDVSVQISPVLGNYWIWDDPATLWDHSLWAF